jgi:hypothetical protein
VQFDFWQAQTLKVLLPFLTFVIMVGLAFFFYKIQEYLYPGRYRNRSLPNPIERAVSIYVQGMVGLTTYVVMVGFAPFRCFRQVDGTFSLVPSSHLNCYDEIWFSNIFIIILGLLEIAIIPLMLKAIFRAYRHSLQDNKFRWQFGMLTENYVDNLFWWEAVVLLKKLVFIMVVDLTNNLDRHLRVFMAEIVLMSVLFAETFFQPRKLQSRMLYVR